jgi:hypothetical protein
MLLSAPPSFALPVLALFAVAGPLPAALGVAPVAVAVPIIPPSGPEDTCPNPRQVTDALQAHLPGLVQPGDRAGARPDGLRAVLDVPADGTVVHFSLVDPRGDVQLRRSIPAPGRGRPAAECAALAETLAEIVERYLSSLQYQAAETAPPPPPSPPPAPPPPEPTGRRGFLFFGGAWVMASSNDPSILAGRLGGEVELTHRPFALVAQLDAAMAQQENVIRMTGSASLRRFSAHAGLALEVPAGPGTFEPGLTAGLDVLRASSDDTATGRTASDYRYSPVVGAETGYRVTLGRHFFLRPRASLGFAIVRYDIAVGGPKDVVFHTSSAFSTFGIDAGVVFR